MNTRPDRRLAHRLRRYRHLDGGNETPTVLHHHRAPKEPSELKDLQRQQELSARLQDQLLRSRAELENYRKRTQRKTQQQSEAANRDLIESLLPVLDNFDRAVANPGDSVEALLSGLEMVRKQMIDELSRQGLEKIESLGQPFDPNLHDAVATEQTDEHPENHVVDVLLDGYKLKDRLLRPAMVRVAARKQGNEQG